MRHYIPTQRRFRGSLRGCTARTDAGGFSEQQGARAVVSCSKNGEVAWTKAFGLADLRTRAPMRPDMVFNHGSDGKVLTAWAMMRLVEAGKVELDAPANRYLKRWQIRSTRFDPNGVTPRRLISHTAGLTVHGFKDYEQGVPLPSLVEVLEGKNQDDGAVYINWEPGTTNVYSGGGFVLAQMILEDVSVAAAIGARSARTSDPRHPNSNSARHTDRRSSPKGPSPPRAGCSRPPGCYAKLGYLAGARTAREQGGCHDERGKPGHDPARIKAR